jgi:outer membrane protein assembly factor BamB
MNLALRSSRLCLLSLLSLAVFMAPAPSPPARPATALTASTGAWTVYHHDDGHTGYDSTLPPVVSVTTGWTSPGLDGEMYASPLVYNGLVYAATLNNTVYALKQSDGTVMWSNHLSAPTTSGWSCGGFQQGILGTPVIDVAGNRIYVTTLSSDHLYRTIGLNLATGVPELATPIPLNLTADTFDWRIQQERGALALRNGYVYVPFGGRAGDCGAYHGWIFAVPINGTAVTHVYETPGQGASFWAAGGPVVDDSTGNLFAASGNGTGSGCAANPDGTPMFENDAVARFSPTLAHTDAFVPLDWHDSWCINDQDLGSAGPLLISPNLMFEAGKWGTGFLLDPTNLGGMDGQLFPTPKPAPYMEADVCVGNVSNTADATFGSFAYAAPFIYLQCRGHGLVALSTNTSTPSFSPCDATCAGPDWQAGGSADFGPPIVAGGAVWVADINGGGLYAFSAATGAQIFHSTGFGVNHFVTPAEAGGQVFVPSHNVMRSFNMNFNLVWSSLGGALTSGPDASSWDSNRFDVFVRGTDNAMYHKAWVGAWSGYDTQGGALTSDPGVVSWGPNRIDVFVRGTDNALYHKVWAGAWYPWESLGGGLTSGPDVASWSSGRLDVFVRGTDNGLWHKVWDGQRWSAWESLGGVLASDPTAVSWGPNRVDVFARATDNTLLHRWWDGVRWNADSLGGSLTSAPDAASCGNGRIDVYATGTGSALFHLGFSGAWGTWQNLGGTWTSEPGAVCQAGTDVIGLFERGTDNALWQSTNLGS